MGAAVAWQRCRSSMCYPAGHLLKPSIIDALQALLSSALNNLRPTGGRTPTGRAALRSWSRDDLPTSVSARSCRCLSQQPQHTEGRRANASDVDSRLLGRLKASPCGSSNSDIARLRFVLVLKLGASDAYCLISAGDLANRRDICGRSVVVEFRLLLEEVCDTCPRAAHDVLEAGPN